jgi:hypothetical protein
MNVKQAVVAITASSNKDARVALFNVSVTETIGDSRGVMLVSNKVKVLAALSYL